MGLTTTQRVDAIVGFRFTERQARFLEIVMRHGGILCAAPVRTVRRRGERRCQIERVLS